MKKVGVVDALLVLTYLLFLRPAPVTGTAYPCGHFDTKGKFYRRVEDSEDGG
jgi:hypothetical protein